MLLAPRGFTVGKVRAKYFCDAVLVVLESFARHILNSKSGITGNFGDRASGLKLCHIVEKHWALEKDTVKNTF